MPTITPNTLTLVCSSLDVPPLFATNDATGQRSGYEPDAAAAVAAEAPAAKAAEPSAQDKIKSERFAALGWDAARVAEREAAIAAKSYSIDWSMLLLTALVVIGYFSFLVRASDKELREVIDERFGPASTTHAKETP